MRYLPLFILLIAGCSASQDQVPESIQGDWQRSARLQGGDNLPQVEISIEPNAYVIDGIRLDLTDIQRDRGRVLASAIHDVRVDTAGFDLGWRVEHGFSWRLDGDSLRERHTTIATFPDSGDEPVEATLKYVYSRR